LKDLPGPKRPKSSSTPSSTRPLKRSTVACSAGAGRPHFVASSSIVDADFTSVGLSKISFWMTSNDAQSEPATQNWRLPSSSKIDQYVEPFWRATTGKPNFALVRSARKPPVASTTARACRSSASFVRVLVVATPAERAPEGAGTLRVPD
jgi:hypothetical protein